MKKLRTLALFLSSLFLTCFVCAFRNNFSAGSERLKYIIVSGDTTTKLFYNNSGKISEVESFSGYQKFYYNNDGLLIKLEDRSNPALFSSTRLPGQKQERITEKNSGITSYTTFEYDNKRLGQTKHFFLKQDKFELTSITRFIYRNNQVVRSSLLDKDGMISQFNAYDYDKNGNIVKEKNFTNSSETGTPKLISETSYTFDNKHNPYVIYKDQGKPGYNTNPNNVVMRKYACYETKSSNSVLKSIYIYDENGFPIEEKNDNNTFTFVYE